MPDPFRGRRKVVGTDTSPRPSASTEFLRRARRLGLDAEEIADLEAQLDNFDEGWTPEMQAALFAKRDRELRESIEWAHRSDEEGTTSEDDARAQAAFAAPMVVTRPIRDVLAWVGDDPIRATAAVKAERARDKPRVTLVEELQKIADGAPV